MVMRLIGLLNEENVEMMVKTDALLVEGDFQLLVPISLGSFLTIASKNAPGSSIDFHLRSQT